jgi:hypothetical protein
MARGRHSKAICDRCGWKYPYLSTLIEGGTRLRVCGECNDGRYNRVDHPQNHPPMDLTDDQHIYLPRPDIPDEEDLAISYLLDENGVLILDEFGYPIHI